VGRASQPPSTDPLLNALRGAFAEAERAYPEVVASCRYIVLRRSPAAPDDFLVPLDLDGRWYERDAFDKPTWHRPGEEKPFAVARPMEFMERREDGERAQVYWIGPNWEEEPIAHCRNRGCHVAVPPRGAVGPGDAIDLANLTRKIAEVLTADGFHAEGNALTDVGAVFGIKDGEHLRISLTLSREAPDRG